MTTTWAYPRPAPPCLPGAPEVADTTNAQEPPDLFGLPAGADVNVEFHGGAYSVWLDGRRRRVNVWRFEFATFRSYEEARHALMRLWRKVEGLESSAAVREAAEQWLKGVTGRDETC